LCASPQRIKDKAMTRRFYIMEQKSDEYQTWLCSRGDITGYDTYADAQSQVTKELHGRRKGQKISIFERHETFQSPPTDIVSDDFNKPE
jgi:hypothetical protein